MFIKISCNFLRSGPSRCPIFLSLPRTSLRSLSLPHSLFLSNYLVSRERFSRSKMCLRMLNHRYPLIELALRLLSSSQISQFFPLLSPYALATEMDASTNYLAQAKDTKDGAKAVVEAPDEEIVVFANGNSNGLKSTNKAPTADSKIAPGGSETSDGAAEGPPADGTASTQTTPADSDAATGLADAFKTLSVNSKPDTKFEYASLNDYRPSAKYPTISVPPHGDVNGSAGLEWQHQQPKIGRKAAEEPSYGAAPPLYGRPLNASASDFQHRGAPTPAYPGYGAPGAGAYGSYQHGIPPIHGSYVNHGYDVFGVSPTLTEPPVSGGVPGGPNPPAANGSNAPGNRYAPPAHRNSANAADPSGMGLNLNGLGGAPNPAPYSPIPMSPSPLSLNPYAAHHHAQMQLNHAHMNGHPMGAAYIPPPGAPAKTDANGAPALGTTPGQNNANAVSNATGGPAASGTARGYAPPTQPFNVPGLPYGVTAGQQYYDESAIYAGYAAPHIQHSIHHPHTVHPQYQLNPQLGPPGHPGTPQLGGYGGYMPGPMVGVPGVGNPGMLPVPGGVAGGPGGPNGGATNHANGGPGGVQHGANVNGSAANGAPSVTTTVNGLTLVNGVPQPNADGTGPSANNRKLGLYKTELCRSWEEKGSCRYGPKCQFAHGEDEIRKVARHPKVCHDGLAFRSHQAF